LSSVFVAEFQLSR